MSQLIDELEEEHKVLGEALVKARDLGIVSKEGQEALFNIKTALLNHLKKEDEQLYPPLQKASETNASLAALLKTFSDEMRGIAEVAMAFFDKYEGEEKPNLEYATDVGTLIGTLKIRIQKEELRLYKEYDKLGL